jgi:GT2 family glycosyltransferase
MVIPGLDLFSRACLAPTGGRVRRATSLGRTARVSVVIPCYNYGHYLGACVASATRQQPGVEVEIIIVDDKSSDDSLRVARAMAAADARIRVIAHQRNMGHIATYNDGLAAATGEFVLLLSADDLVTPGALTRAAALLVAEPSVGLVYGRAIHFERDPPPARTLGKTWIIWPGVDWLRDRCRRGYNVVASPEVVMRVSVLRAVGGYRVDLPHAGDFEMWLRAAAVSDVGFLVGVDQAYYRHHATNMNRKDFASGTARGQLTDLTQRWQSFEAVFAGVGGRLEQGAMLRETARRTLALEAIEHVSHAYARGLRDFPVDEFEALARRIQPEVDASGAARTLAWRKRFGMVSMPVHPLWTMSIIARRIRDLVKSWRWRRIGI